MASAQPAPNHAQQVLSIETYSKQFFTKFARCGYGSSEEENLAVAGKNLLTLLQKLLQAGERTDVAIPLRVFRDQVTELYNQNPRSLREQQIERFFRLYDRLEEEATRAQRPGQPDAVMEEIRLRLYKLVAGDTWEAYPELRVLALKRFYAYMRKEKASAAKTQAMGFGSGGVPSSFSAPAPPSTSDRLFKMVGSRIHHKILPPTATSWEAAFDDLTKSGGPKLMPLLKEVLGGLYDAERQVKEYEGLLAAHQLIPKASSVPAGGATGPGTQFPGAPGPSSALGAAASTGSTATATATGPGSSTSPTYPPPSTGGIPAAAPPAPAAFLPSPPQPPSSSAPPPPSTAAPAVSSMFPASAQPSYGQTLPPPAAPEAASFPVGTTFTGKPQPGGPQGFIDFSKIDMDEFALPVENAPKPTYYFGFPPESAQATSTTEAQALQRGPGQGPSAPSSAMMMAPAPSFGLSSTTAAAAAAAASPPSSQPPVDPFAMSDFDFNAAAAAPPAGPGASSTTGGTAGGSFGPGTGTGAADPFDAFPQQLQQQPTKTGGQLYPEPYEYGGSGGGGSGGGGEYRPMHPTAGKPVGPLSPKPQPPPKEEDKFADLLKDLKFV